MSRATFSGPILAGTQRQQPFQNTGGAMMTQTAVINLAATVGNVGYAGASGTLADARTFQNTTVFIPNASAVTTARTVPADGATVFRGVVMYLPVNAVIHDFIVDVTTAITGGSITAATMQISNDLGNQTVTYGSVANVLATGRQAIVQTAAQLANVRATSTDIINPTLTGQPAVSQLVWTITETTTTAATAGILTCTVRYSLFDDRTGFATI